MKYNITKKVNLSFEEALEKVKENLLSEGFGILTQINVQETLKKKLNVDFEKYIILGACNPHFAHKALSTEYEIGLLLPCNIIIYEQNKKIYISAINPIIGMGFIENKKLKNIAKLITNKLKIVIDKTN